MYRSQMQVADLPRARRVPRNPKHPFQVRTQPYALTPFCMVPVLPGETVKFINWQARVVTDPIKERLVGWHTEYYWFYCKFRDLAEGATLTQMVINPGQDITAIDDVTTDVNWYHAGTVNNLNWTKMCTIAITEEFFREEGEAWNAALIGAYPAVRIPQQGWFDSLTTAALAGAASEDPVLTVGVDDQFAASEIDSLLAQYELLRYQGLTSQTYEEYLMTYGVRPAVAEVNKPELLRYTKHWQYPVNTVEPTTGVPTSAVSWSVQERVDKDYFCKEPGFIVGLTCHRPKVYLSNQRGSVHALLNGALQWLPATVSNSRVAQRVVSNANALLAGQSASWWVDLKDLFVYGDQFVNFDMATATDGSLVALPTAAAVAKYPTSTMVDALFKNIAPANKVRQDGIASLMIAGSVHDAYPGQS